MVWGVWDSLLWVMSHWPWGQQSPETARRPLILPLSFFLSFLPQLHAQAHKGMSSSAGFLQHTPGCVGASLSVTAHFRMDSSCTGNGSRTGGCSWREGQGSSLLLCSLLEWAQSLTAKEELQQGCLLSLLWDIHLEKKLRAISLCHDPRPSLMDPSCRAEGQGIL